MQLLQIANVSKYARIEPVETTKYQTNLTGTTSLSSWITSFMVTTLETVQLRYGSEKGHLFMKSIKYQAFATNFFFKCSHFLTKHNHATCSY